MNYLLGILGILLVALGSTAGLWLPLPYSIFVAFILGFSGGWMIGEGSDSY